MDITQTIEYKHLVKIVEAFFKRYHFKNTAHNIKLWDSKNGDPRLMVELYDWDRQFDLYPIDPFSKEFKHLHRPTIEAKMLEDLGALLIIPN